MAKKTESRVDLVVRLHEQGLGVTDIIDAADMSYDRVLRILKTKGLYKKPMKRYSDRDSKMELRGLIEDINTKVSLSKPSVEKIEEVIFAKAPKVFEYHGHSFDTYSEMKEFKKQMSIKVKLLSAEGKTRDEIAELTGLGRKSIAKILR